MPRTLDFLWSPSPKSCAVLQRAKELNYRPNLAVLTPLMGWIAMHTHSIAAAHQVPLYSYVRIGLMMMRMS